jgi:transcription elongation GreA/GreB family factor
MDAFTMIFKEKIFQHVRSLLEQRLHNAQAAMEAAQASANDQGKSSAGDKYETARAMGQLDREMHATQWKKAEQELLFFDRIAHLPAAQRIGPGALVQTDSAWYLVAVSVGFFEVEGQRIGGISAQSPLGQQLQGKAVGEQVAWGQQRYIILSVS